MLPLALPGVVAGSIFTFSLTLGDYITPLLIGSGSGTNLIGNVIYDNIGLANNLPVRCRARRRADRDHGRLPSRSAGARRVRGDVMEGRVTRFALVAWVIGVLVFLFLPIATIVIFAFDRSNVQSWPIRHFTTHWFSVAWDDPAVRSALWLSVKAGIGAMLLALLLGSAAAFGVHRYRFFGREAVSLFLGPADRPSRG